MTYLFDRAADHDDTESCEWLERYARHDRPAAMAERIRHLFSNAGAILGPYTDDQIARGLMDIIDGGELYAFNTGQLPVVLRTTGLRSIVTLFTEIFAVRIAVEDPQLRPKLERTCFMFFDAAAINLGDDTVLDVLEEILALPSIPCQRAALHGLGHAHFEAAHHAQVIVDRWLKTHPGAPQELRDYATAARDGNVM